MNKILLHAPHSSMRLPKKFFKNILIEKELVVKFNKTITDMFIDQLFNAKTHNNIKAKYSRIFCDVEKFADNEKEEMSKFGMGFVYSHTHEGVQFINPTKKYKDKIYNKYYKKHHEKLNRKTEKLLKRGKVILIDCHSFSEDIIMFKEKRTNLPDICIGYDELYYNKNLVSFIKLYFENLGYDVKLNYPYSGTMIPSLYLDKKVENLYSLMIEINKKIYLNENNQKSSNFNSLQNQIKGLLKQIRKIKI